MFRGIGVIQVPGTDIVGGKIAGAVLRLNAGFVKPGILVDGPAAETAAESKRAIDDCVNFVVVMSTRGAGNRYHVGRKIPSGNAGRVLSLAVVCLHKCQAHLSSRRNA